MTRGLSRSTMALLSASDLSLYHGDLMVFSGVSLEVQERSRIGIVGPNGSGKTSLVRTLLGEVEPTAGMVNTARGLRTGYVPQTAAPLVEGTLLDEVMLAFQRHRDLEAEMARLAEAMPGLAPAEREGVEARYAAALEEYEARGGYNQENSLERAVAGVGLNEPALATPSAKASGGERTRAALARGLLAEPDLLILDEPTNHLDLGGLAWLERFLNRFPHAFITVSHDRYFLDRVATEIWELEGGRLQVFPGNYTRYKVLKAEQIERQRREYDKQQAYITKEEEFIRRYGAGQRAQEAQGRETRLRRLERLEAPEEQAALRLHRLPVARSPQVVLQTKGLSIGVPAASAPGGVQVLASVPDLKLERGFRTAIIGPNGAGKTTLLRTLLGHIPPVAGEGRISPGVQTGYYRQGLDDLPLDATVLEAVREVMPVSEGQARSYLARFLFRGDDVYQRAGTLSGGERGRLALARLLAQGPNLLCLDEPTNHLDINSREALEQVLLDYEGTLLFISHDRRLISLLATQLWVLEDGAIRPFAGTFEEWQAAQADAEAAERTMKAAAAKADARPRPAKPAQPKTAAKAEERAAKRVAELEQRLKEIEEQLSWASAAQDVQAVARLGEEHRTAQAQLDEAWEEWAKVV